MKTKKHFIVAVIAMVLAFAAGGAQAQDAKPSPSPTPGPTISAEKLALIRELLALANAKETVDAIIKAQSEQFEKDFPEIIWQATVKMKELELLTPKEREVLHQEVIASSVEIGRKMYVLFKAKVEFGKVVEDISLDLYDKYFTESELRDLVAFNKSETGRKVIEKMPRLYSESMARTSEVLGPKLIEVIKQLQDEQTKQIASEIQAKASKKPAKPPATNSPKHRRH